MVRGARPSDLYRLPEQTPVTSGSPPPQPPRRRFPAWLGVALVLAVVLVISGLIGTTAPPTTGSGPLVDIISEDQAIAALALYGAQASTIAELRERRDIYAVPGPRDAAGVARRGAADSQRTLDAARKLVNPDPKVQAYVQHADHAIVTRSLVELADLADMIALLSLTHETIYDGQGSIPLQEASARITSLLAGGSVPPSLSAWGTALLEQLEDRPRLHVAEAMRSASQRLWASIISNLRPAAVEQLRRYVDGLPAVTVDGLRGHPVAGPALRLLNRGTTSPSARR